MWQNIILPVDKLDISYLLKKAEYSYGFNSPNTDRPVGPLVRERLFSVQHGSGGGQYPGRGNIFEGTVHLM